MNMLGISPFTYGLVIEKIYDDGSMLDPEILDITNDQLKASFMQVRESCGSDKPITLFKYFSFLWKLSIFHELSTRLGCVYSLDIPLEFNLILTK